MALFPFYIDITGKEGWIIGGGDMALEKIERLLPFAPKLLIFSENPKESLKNKIQNLQGNGINIELFQHVPEMEQIEHLPEFVIIADESQESTKGWVQWCKENRVLVNVVDTPALCQFVFPSLIIKGKLTIGISTSGASPSAATYIKEQILSTIPESTEEILDWLAEIRLYIKEKIANPKMRAKALKQLTQMVMTEDRILTDQELEDFLNTWN